ncbi:hypothetical protein PVAND_016911 [Polypedilum vanderplanki]|uniref:Cuticle protein n=1 Tax=Polypedilum vanderplanki TaxID=319348 RepID=A0A9J6BH67_POLVA|nr:hypothetical protein PVAND_016911 [Polypedilum vanderplanki]
MKFAVVFAAIFACASAGVVPYAAWPYAASWDHTAPLGSPITQYSSGHAAHIVATPTAHLVAAPAVSYAAHIAAPYVAASPYVAHVPAVVAHAPVAKVIAPAAASYTAATRGAVHTAPLEGHAVSQTSLNLASAPGTL